MRILFLEPNCQKHTCTLHSSDLLSSNPPLNPSGCLPPSCRAGTVTPFTLQPNFCLHPLQSPLPLMAQQRAWGTAAAGNNVETGSERVCIVVQRGCAGFHSCGDVQQDQMDGADLLTPLLCFCVVPCFEEFVF